MKFENTEVMNFKGAFRGLRNPLQSWERSDSEFGTIRINFCDQDFRVADSYCKKNKVDMMSDHYDIEQDKYSNWLREQGILNISDDDSITFAFIGANDLDLAQRMIKAGTSDRKFMRQIMVCVDITAPLYWWKEFDTYKVGTVANSTSTMHKIASTPITKDCFEMDDCEPDLLLEYDDDPTFTVKVGDRVFTFIDFLEQLRQKYLETKDKRYWKELIRWLPNGWLQTRTVTLNYEVLRNIYFQRRYHKLSEWHQFCEWIESLPYAKELITYEG